MQYTQLNWRDGQLYSEMFDDIYYSSKEGECISGEAEFKHVFFKNNGLPERWTEYCSEKQNFVVAELGFGSGLNCLLTIREWLNHLNDSEQGGCLHSRCLHYIAIEKYPLSPEAINTLVSRYPELEDYCTELVDTYPPAVEGSHSRILFDNRVMIHYKFMDAFDALRHEDYQVDAWYLDGFSPAKNADMWSMNLFEKIAQNSHNKTTCCTYTAAGSVKRNLQGAGFEVDKVAGFGKKRDMLTAKINDQQQKQYRFVDKPWFSPPVRPTYEKQHALIIGAGIAGLSVAYSLARRGWTVTVIDEHGAPARATSSNPAAIIYPRLSVNSDIDTRFNVQAYCYALYELNDLQKRYDKEFWFDCGLDQLMDKKRYSDIVDRYQFNEDFLSLSKDKTHAGDFSSVEQRADDITQVWVEYKAAGVVLPQVLCDVLVRECGDNIRIKKDTVNGIKRTDDRWCCYKDDRLIHESEILIIANGIEVNHLTSEFDFPIESIRGQSLVLSEQKQTKAITKVMNAGVYLTPSIHGKHHLGATYSRGNDSLDVDEKDAAELFAGLNRACASANANAFSSECIECGWVGFRATSKDRVPLVGAVANSQFYRRHYADINHGKKDKIYPPAEHYDGLFMSAAHGSRGFTTSFLCAELIASQVAGGPNPVSKPVVDLLNSSRFIVNELKRR